MEEIVADHHSCLSERSEKSGEISSLAKKFHFFEHSVCWKIDLPVNVKDLVLREKGGRVEEEPFFLLFYKSYNEGEILAQSFEFFKHGIGMRLEGDLLNQIHEGVSRKTQFREDEKIYIPLFCPLDVVNMHKKIFSDVS